MSSELENSGIRVAVGDCSVTERVHAKHNKHNEDGRTAPGVCGNGSVPLSHPGNVLARIEIHTHLLSKPAVMISRKVDKNTFMDD